MELVVGGACLFAATGGRPPELDRPAIVFLHGAGMDHSVWMLQARYFAHHKCAVYALDLPGHGRSDGPPRKTVEAMADAVWAAIAAAGRECVALVGHSMGGLVALEAAGRAPHRVTALALLGTGLPMRVDEGLLAAARDGDSLAVELMIGWGYGLRAQLGGHPAPGLWMSGGGARLLERAPPGTLHADLLACDRYDGGQRAATPLNCPLLVIEGTEDRMIPGSAVAALAAALPEAEAIRVQCGHLMMDEQPDAVLDALIAFLDRAL